MTTPVAVRTNRAVEPTVILYIINTAVLLFVSFGLNLSHPQVQAISVISTALLAGIAAALTRPLAVSVLAAAATTILTAAAAFGLHLTADQIGELVGLGSTVAGILISVRVSPHPALVQRVQRSR